MATCGSVSLWCGLCVLATFAGIGMSQFNNGSQLNNGSPFNTNSQQTPGSQLNTGSQFNTGSAQQTPGSQFNTGSAQQTPGSQFNTGSVQQTPSPDNCTAYTPGSPCNFPELATKMYCLANGSFVTGFCAAQAAFCGNHIPLQRDLTACSSIRDSTTTSRTSASTGSSTSGLTFNQRERSFNNHQHDRTDDRHDDSAAPFSHTSCGIIVLCGLAAVASHLFSLL